MSLTYNIPAYAKINLFLHITSVRSDNYHNLQTIFQFVDLHDTLNFTKRTDDKIKITSNINICPTTDNIVYKAAKILKNLATRPCGIDIYIEKNIPMGAGLGGGSSNCASTLIFLNKLWNCNLTQKTLISMGANLGADVPIFIKGRTSWAEGTGALLSPFDYQEQFILLIFPKIHINTKNIFQHTNLKRNYIKIKPYQFNFDNSENVFEKIVRKSYPSIEKIFNSIPHEAKARLTGTGSCIYCLSKNKSSLYDIVKKLNKELDTKVIKTVNFCPVDQMIKQKTDE